MFGFGRVRVGFLLGCCAAMALLPGCDLHEETRLNQSRVELTQERFSNSYALGDLDAGAIAALGRDFSRHGGDTAHVTLAYDPRGADAVAKATQQLATLSQSLRRAGMDKLDARLLPVNNTGAEPRVLIAYDSYTAGAPKDCKTMSGFSDRNVDVDEEYGLGCTLDSVMARQIARPADLAGQEISPQSDGRRGSNIVEVYRTGEPNKPLAGESSSGKQ